MSDLSDWMLESHGFYEPQEFCKKHKESWPVSDEYGCRQCYEEYCREHKEEQYAESGDE